MSNHVATSICLVLGLASLSKPSSAQFQQAVQNEFRIDGIFAHSPAVEAGYGVSIPAGIYVRNGFVGGIGLSRHGADGRLDLLSRFSLDPFRQSRWTPYGGAGISGRFRPREDGGSHGYLMVYVGLEGPLKTGARKGWEPAFEVGLGGGARVGLVIRQGMLGRR